MLKSYEAIYDHGKIRWLADQPPVEESRVIVTILPDPGRDSNQAVRKPSRLIAGKGKILGDIIAPVSPAGDWEALK